MKNPKPKPLTPLQEAENRIRLLENDVACAKSRCSALQAELVKAQANIAFFKRLYEELCDDVFKPGFRPHPKSFAGRAARRRKPTGG